jgi:DMSO reductase anchor subunit
MSLLSAELISAGIFFVFIIIFGFWLRFTGKPYNMLIITVHKLVGVAMGVYLGKMVYETHQVSPLSPVQITSIIVTVLFFVGLVATGSLLSAEKEMPSTVKVLHRVMPYLTIISTGVMLYLLGG